MGERALLVETASLEHVLALHARLAASRPDGVVDLVPAARTVLVRIDPGVLSVSAARSWIAHAPAVAASRSAVDAVVELDVTYDGPDLGETAELLGVTADELVRRHADAVWTVAFTGFAPGFGYLVSADWPFDVPRLATPRTRVPAGSVGVAAGFAGAYPRETPGGWRLVGTTRAVLFDPDAASPALLAPGTRVRFRAVRGAARASAAPPPQPDRATSVHPRRSDAPRVHGSGADAVRGGADATLRIVDPGLLATVQDLGRAGAASLGVAPSGALDRSALRTANRLVGNPEDAAGVEVTMGGLRAVAERDTWFAIAGAWGRVELDGRDVDPYEAHAWPAGAELHLDWFAHGARAYLAVRGGVDTATALGSSATDVLAGLGPAPLHAGDALAVGTASAPIPVPGIAPWGAPHDDEVEIELAPGPRADWFAPSALAALFEQAWTVTNDADRVGMRLDGPELARTRDGELPSEGMVPGAVQVPLAGRPVVLLADGPVTGGYPVIAVVTDASLDRLAQARPGTRIRFRHARPPR
nr:urea amidolyase family protein [Microbacterium ulmi]